MMVCAHPGCRALVERGRCDKHKAPGRKNRSGDPFYSSKVWRRLRGMQLRREPLCRECRGAGRVREASVVDHIKTRADRPDLELEPSNLQSLCPACHNKKTMSEQQAQRRGDGQKL